MILGEKQGSIKLKDLAEEMQLAPEETLGFLRQVFPPGTGLEVYHKDNDSWVDIKSEAIQYMLPLAPSEWIQLHQILSHHKGGESSAVYSLKKKVTENGPIKVVMELLNQLELWDRELSENQQRMVQSLDHAIAEKHLLNLSTKEEKSYLLHPCKVLHLEGSLSLIAEDYQDHCLIVVPLNEVQAFEQVHSSAQPKVTSYEIEEFISAIRAMNEREMRLILKIHDPGPINLFPDHHFLGKPCMITNPNGDLIWAAYVEPCDDLYEWLMSLGKKVEILDPISFREEYIMYCEEKLKKIA